MDKTTAEPAESLDEQFTNYLREKLTKCESELGTDHPDIADNILPLAVDLIRHGNGPSAEALLLRALCIRESFFGTTHPKTAEVLEKLSAIYRNERKFDQSEACLRRALCIRSDEGNVTWEYASALELLALLESAKGNFDQAESIYLDAIAIVEKVFEPDDSWCLVHTLWHFGMMLETHKRYEKTLEIGDRLRRFAKTSAAEDCSALDLLAMRARALNLLGRHEEWREAVNEIKGLMIEAHSSFEASESWLTGCDPAAVVTAKSDQ